MRTRIRILAIVALAALFLIPAVHAKSKERLKQSFDGIDRIKIETVSGDCVVEKGESDAVSLTVLAKYSPEDSFEPQVKQRGGTLYLEEEILRSNSGYSTWILTVPDGIEIDFETASGDLSVSEVNGSFSVSTASGDIEFEVSSGDFEFSTASGDIRMEKCKGVYDISTASGDIRTADCEGEFSLSTASGDVMARLVTIKDESRFSTASGDISVRLGKPLEHDIRMGTASGSAMLDLNGHPPKGRFELTAKVHSGDIDCPFSFDEEEKFERHGDDYVTKSFTKGSDQPLVMISTASGEAELRK
jgi:DUF4097 and DUF4098 domain-containing protein YvlB